MARTSYYVCIWILSDISVATPDLLPWSMCISFGTDNASVMVGSKSGVATLIRKKNPNTYID